MVVPTPIPAAGNTPTSIHAARPFLVTPRPPGHPQPPPSPASLGEQSLHGDAFGKIARLIHIEAAVGGDVVAEQLHRNHREQRAEQLVQSRR